jgi:hypothetical protein
MAIFPASPASLSQEEIGDAIYSHLTGLTVEQLRSEPLAILPHQTLSSIYYSLRATEREIVGAAGLALLESLLENSSKWNPESADELLLFMDEIAPSIDQRDRLVETLLSLSQRLTPRTIEGIDLRLRALGLLLGIGFRAAPEFWEAIYETGGDAYVYSVFDGLALIDPRLALQWSNRLSDEQSQEVISECLPGLIEDIGVGTFLKLVPSILVTLKPAAAAALIAGARYEGIHLEWYDPDYQAQVGATPQVPELAPPAGQLQIQSLNFDEVLLAAYERNEIDAPALYDTSCAKSGIAVARKTSEEALARRIRNGEWPVGDAALLYSRNPAILSNPEHLDPLDAIRLQDEAVGDPRLEPLTALVA